MIKKIWLKGYRNLEETVLECADQNRFFIIGNNNQGKTNLLEALFF